MAIRFNQQLKKVILCVGQAGLANAPTGVSATVIVGATTANTRLPVPHGLGFAPKVLACDVVAVGLDDDIVQPGFAIVKTDSTNVTVKPTTTQAATAVQFLLTIELDQTAAPVNAA